MKSPISNFQFSLLVVLGALSAFVFRASADPLVVPFQMSDFVKASLHDSRLQFTRVETGDPTIDDGSTVQLSADKDRKITVDRAPYFTSVDIRQNNKDSARLTIHNNDVRISATVPLKSGAVQIEFTQTTSANTDNLVLKAASPDHKIAIQCTAHTFAELLRDHPDDVATYLIPLFETLDLGVLYVRPQDAARAFAAQFKPDEKTRAAVLTILPRLDDDAPKIRAAAAAELAALLPGAVPILQSLDLAQLPVQTRSTIRIALQPYANPSALKDPTFLTLCLATDDPQIPALAKAQLEKLTAKPLNFNPDAPLPQRQSAALKLLAQ